MKKLSLATILIVSLLWASQSLAQTTPIADEVFRFSKTAETAAPVTTADETSTVAVNTEETAPSEDALLADAQTIIKDNLIEKYQVRLDKIMEQISKNLAGAPANIQRQALTEVKGRVEEKKTVFLAKKNIDPMKRDITVAVLDYIILRVEGMIQESAQTVVTTPV